MIIAQLIIKGEKYGPHPFLIPIRDLKTHEPFPGVDVGDIGPKMGMSTTDNGFIRFNHYRVPLKHMLNKFSRINEEGEYELINPNSIKILYLSLVNTRLAILELAWLPICMAVTVAIRYSFVRQQFTDPDNPSQERKIIEYNIQQSKLFKLLAYLYSFIFIIQNAKDFFNQAKNEVNNPGKENQGSLQITHVVMSLFKVFETNYGMEAIETCRRSCGGHGFMMISGLNHLYCNEVPALTYEGDNSILALQAIKYLVSLCKRKPPPVFSFIFGAKISPTGDPLTKEYQQQCFEAIAQFRVIRLHNRLELLLKKYNKEKIWNDFLQIEGIDAAESVYHAIVHRFYCENVNKIDNEPNRNAVEKLRVIYAATELEKYAGDLFNVGVSLKTLETIKEDYLNALSITRNNALSLIEAFEIKDETLNSALGRKDGDVYNHILEYSRNINPINKNKVFPGIHQYLKPKI